MAQATDATGVLAILSLQSDSVPFGRLFAMGDADVREGFRTTPFDARLTVPSRGLDTLPPVLGLKEARGQIEGTATWHGAMERPTVDVTASVTNGRADVTVLALPLDVNASVHYDGAHARAAVGANVRNEPVLDAHVDVDVQAPDLLAALDGTSLPWTGSARATLTRFPLQTVGPLDERQVRGRASGQFEVSGLHEDGHAKVSLAFEDLSVADVACKSASAGGSLDGHVLDFQGARRSEGRLRGIAYAGRFALGCRLSALARRVPTGQSRVIGQSVPCRGLAPVPVGSLHRARRARLGEHEGRRQSARPNGATRRDLGVEGRRLRVLPGRRRRISRRIGDGDGNSGRSRAPRECIGSRTERAVAGGCHAALARPRTCWSPCSGPGATEGATAAGVQWSSNGDPRRARRRRRSPRDERGTAQDQCGRECPVHARPAAALRDT